MNKIGSAELKALKKYYKGDLKEAEELLKKNYPIQYLIGFVEFYNCQIEVNKNVLITEFKNITSEIAFLEGEGDKSLNYYQKEHQELFKQINKNFNENTKVVVEIFKVIKKL